MKIIIRPRKSCPGRHCLLRLENNGRGVVTVYEPQQERAHSARSMMSLDEQWHMIKDNHLMMIARSVASPRIPESCNFWLISLRLWTSREKCWKSTPSVPAAEPELYMRWTAVYLANSSARMPLRLPKRPRGRPSLSAAGLASATLIDELLDLLDKGPLPGRLLHLVIAIDVVANPDPNVQTGLQSSATLAAVWCSAGGTQHGAL